MTDSARPIDDSPPRIHFVTGRLAERALREQLEMLGQLIDVRYTIDVLPITVAALMTTRWVAARIKTPSGTNRVILPGYCQGDLNLVRAVAGTARVERGPRDLRELPEFLGQASQRPRLDDFTIEILAEINSAPRLDRSEINALARRYRESGADVIDIGCDPDGPWLGVADCVRSLRDEGLRVSIDSLDPREIAPAVRSGAELVLSVNSHNRDAALDWGCEVVAIPDDPATEAGLHETIEFLHQRNIPLRIDPILEPIGCGFARSLARYWITRHRYPGAEMLMGIGNLTELTDCDSAAINLLLLGACQELDISTVLTTQVIPWAQSSIRECDVARRMVRYAVEHHSPPKRLDERLVMLRDARLLPFGIDHMDRLSEELRDSNYRLFAEEGEFHLVSAGLHLHDADPYVVFSRLMRAGPQGAAPANIDPAHAFYLGFEAAKAATALTLGKQYRQDESLDWGLLTRPEINHRSTRQIGKANSTVPPEESNGTDPKVAQ